MRGMSGQSRRNWRVGGISHVKRTALRSLAASAAVLLVGVGAAIPARAAGTLDQSNTTPTNSGVELCSTYLLGQTFTAGSTGSLDQVDLDLSEEGSQVLGNLTVQITTTSGGQPTSAVLATATVAQAAVSNWPVSSWVQVPLSPPAPSVAGTTYAIVLSAPGATCPNANDINNTYLWAVSGDTYPSGAATVRDPAGNWSPNSNHDVLFKTYVTPACDRTVSSPTGGFTASGRTCVTNTTVNGSIVVPAGASLVLTNATVNGSVTSNGANAITICGSHIAGAASIQHSTGPVLVGDGAWDESCDGNTIGGAVQLIGNTANTELGGNHISGSVTFANNTGTASSAETSPEIEANTIGGSLSCSGNSPAPTGGANTVSGSRTGQCAGF